MGMMAVSDNPLPVSDVSRDKANNEYLEKKYGRKTRATISNILEFADMQTREMFDPAKNEADAIFAQSIILTSEWNRQDRAHRKAPGFPSIQPASPKTPILHIRRLPALLSYSSPVPLSASSK